LDSCTEILKDSNYQLATAGNGSVGLKKMQEFQPDLVFVDLKMPGLSGLEVLEKIQTSDPNVVTIVITGFATVSSAVEAMKQGAYDFLPKPFTPDEFRLITERGLEKRKLVLETIALRIEKEMLREQFAAIVSHELKTPLVAVQQNLFALEAALTEVLTDDQKNRFERIKSRINDLLGLIKTWLRVFSTDIETLKETFVPVSVATLISKTVASLEPHAVRKDISIITTIEKSIGYVFGEEGTLIEALINISNNAIKYTHMGGKIHFKAQKNHGLVEISISDTGVGISEEDLPFIFDDFYSGKSAQRAVRGSGLGLAISRRIIETHNGSITVNSEFGKGSTFNITLPVFEIEYASDASP
jgi:signal transduction histidine kinase